jgi:hypothetical protein
MGKHMRCMDPLLLGRALAAYRPLFPSCTPKKAEEEGAGEDEGGVETEDGGKGGGRWEMGL